MNLLVIPKSPDDEEYKGLQPTAHIRFRDVGNYTVVLEQYWEQDINVLGRVEPKWLPVPYVEIPIPYVEKDADKG